MNAFSVFERGVRAASIDREGWTVTVDRPRRAEGIWYLTIVGLEDYAIEVEWNRHRGFGIVAGWELAFGAGVDEIIGSADAAVARVVALMAHPATTSTDRAIDLSELRKLGGLLQKDVASKLGMTKGGLAQLEKRHALASMQVDTLQRIVAVLGGELVISVDFPEGRRRRLSA